MNKIIVLIALLAFFAVAAIFFLSQEKQVQLKEIELPSGAVFSCEVADDPQERAIGLMNRSTLCASCCMLFVFEEKSIHGFWMKNTLIPLDIVFFDEQWSLASKSLAWCIIRR